MRERIHAPELSGAAGWLNTAAPLSMRELRGGPALFDFGGSTASGVAQEDGGPQASGLGPRAKGWFTAILQTPPGVGLSPGEGKLVIEIVVRLLGHGQREVRFTLPLEIPT